MDNRATQLAILHRTVQECRSCTLHEAYENVLAVPGIGNIDADIMIVGEAPGYNESMIGKPFVGVSGKVLQRLLKAEGLTLDQLYVTNVVKCRPPDNRDPTYEEATTCIHKFLASQIDLVAPKTILCVGKVASIYVSHLAGVNLPNSGLRGKRFTYNDMPVICTWHPAYVMRVRAREPELAKDIRTAITLAEGRT